MKKFLMGLFALLLPSFALASYNGTPTPKADFEKDGNCYLIKTTENLYGFAALVNGGETGACGILTAEITVNENVLDRVDDAGKVIPGCASSSSCTHVWTPIGSEDHQYAGSFNGNGFAVKGLYYDNAGLTYIGLFGVVGSEGMVDRASVEDSYFKGVTYVGGVVGSNYGNISNCSNAATITTVADGYGAFAGGIAGYNRGGNITNCNNSGLITSEILSGGGIAGDNEGHIVNCSNSAAVVAKEYAGGIVGWNKNSGVIMNSYNAGSISNGTYVGGVAGHNLNEITNSFSLTNDNADDFDNGTIALQLHNWCEKEDGPEICKADGKNGSVWGQNAGSSVDHDAYPVLSRNYDQSGNLLPGEIKFGIEYVLNDEDADAGDSPQNYTYGKGVSLKYPTRSGFAFVGWYENAEFTGNAVTSIADNATGTKTFYAKWQEIPALVNNCYEIANVDQLYGFAALVNKTVKVPSGVPYGPSICGKLKNDIVVNENVLEHFNTDGTPVAGAVLSGFKVWTPIGVNKDNQYTGSFNGNGFAVKGLYFNKESDENVGIGLFGYVGTNGTVDHVGVEDSYFKAYSCVGGVVGINNGSVTNSYNSGSANAKVIYAGGIVGENKGSVTNCYNSGSLNAGLATVGGIAGMNEGSVANCYNMSIIDGSGTCVSYGSVVGLNSGSITNCFAKSGSANGLVGVMSKSADATSGFKTEDEFNNGTVAILLHNWCEKDGDVCKAGGKNGSIWGQYVGVGAGHDAYPVLGNGENGTGVVKFDIEYVLNGGTKAEDAPKTYAYGEGASLKDPTRAGYTFEDWFTSADFDGKTVTSIADDATGAKTFYAKWSDPIPYTITYKNESGATNTNPTSYTVKTEEVDLLPLTRDGYKFQGWFDGEGDDALEVEKVAGGKVGDIILYASWSIESYKIAAVANDASMGTVSGSGTYEYGAEVELVATAAEFYHFTNWQDDADAKATRKVSVAVGGASYVANFAGDVFNVTLNANGGTVANELKEYTYGEGATLPLATKSGFSFAGWFASSDANAKEVKAISKTDHGDKEFFAKWNAVQSSSSSLPSDAQESSSSVNSASSSSAKSSSSNKTEYVVVAAQLPQFRVAVLDRKIQISGAYAGSNIAIFDMQGRVITKGVVAAANFAVEMPGAGSYMVRIGEHFQRVNVR